MRPAKYYLEHRDCHFRVSPFALRWLFDNNEREEHWFSMRVSMTVDKWGMRAVYFSTRIADNEHWDRVFGAAMDYTDEDLKVRYMQQNAQLHQRPLVQREENLC